MGAGWTMRAVYTPGHTSNHMCYVLDEERALFTGDHVMGWRPPGVNAPTATCAPTSTRCAR